MANRNRADQFYDDLFNAMQITDPRGDFYSPCLTDCENVGPIPHRFLHDHGIPREPSGRQYYCTAYGDLFAYKTPDQNPPDRGVGFDWVTWTWSI